MSINAFIQKHGIKLVQVVSEERSPVFITLDRNNFRPWQVVLSRQQGEDEFSPFFSAPTTEQTITVHTAFDTSVVPTLFRVMVDQWEDLESAAEPGNDFESWLQFQSNPEDPRKREQWDLMQVQTGAVRAWLGPDLDEFMDAYSYEDEEEDPEEAAPPPTTPTSTMGPVDGRWHHHWRIDHSHH